MLLSRYSGQWWEAITVSSRLLILALTAALYYKLHASTEERRLKNLPGFQSFYKT